MKRSYLFTYILIPALMFCAGEVCAKPKAPESPGIQAGGFVMHPGADLSVAYDSRGSEPSDGFFEGGVHFKTRLQNNETKDWDNSLALSWRQFFGVGEAQADGGLNASISSRADLFKKSTFRFSPSLIYQYSDDPEDDNLRNDYENHQLRAGLSFFIQPSGGAVFSQNLAYQFRGWFYTEYSDVSHLENMVTSVTRWNFMPQTSMSLNVDFRYISYIENEHKVNSVSDAASLANRSSLPLRLKYSLQGLMFARFSYVLGLGYAYEYYPDGPSEHMFIMNARLRYDFSDHAGLFVEYKKDFDNVVYGDYYKFHRVVLGFEGVWFDRLQTDLELGYGLFDVKSELQNAREDNLLTASAGVSYHIIPGFSVGLDYRLRYNASTASGAEYVKNMLALKLSYEY